MEEKKICINCGRVIEEGDHFIEFVRGLTMEKITLYIGLNDQNTKRQKVDTLEAIKDALNQESIIIQRDEISTEIA